ncbi:MAG: sigma factor-like helix-turn-helix DNA-binding protein [Lachnospiraceae bacterium]
MREAIAALPERERQVIGLRFFHDMTQDAAARVIGVLQQQAPGGGRRAVGEAGGSF